MTEQAVTIWQYCVVDVHILKNLDDSKRGAGQDALLTLSLRVQKTDVLVHVEDVAVTQSLDILGNIDDLLQVLVLTVVEDWVVDDDAVNGGIGVCAQDGFFNVIAGNFTEGVLEPTISE